MPKINTKSLCDESGKIYENLKESEDFIILDYKLYSIFKNWYDIVGPELKRFFVINPSSIVVSETYKFFNFLNNFNIFYSLYLI